MHPPSLRPDAGSGAAPGQPGLPRGTTVRRTHADEPAIDYLVRVPRQTAQRPRLLLSIHGIAERPDHHLERFAPLAEAYGVVLVAPRFAEPRFRDYQRLGRAGRGERADLALDRIAAEVAALTGAAAARFFLFGYSGGAQFAHRYAMAHPTRVVAAVAASAGWYTMPDPHRRYPYGTRHSKALGSIRFDANAFLRVPMLVCVGAADVERDDALRQSESLDAQQGSNRVERARRWVRAIRRAARGRGLAPSVSLHEIPGAHHSFEACAEAGLGEIVFQYLFGPEPLGDLPTALGSHARRDP